MEFPETADPTIKNNFIQINKICSKGTGPFQHDGGSIENILPTVQHPLKTAAAACNAIPACTGFNYQNHPTFRYQTFTEGEITEGLCSENGNEHNFFVRKKTRFSETILLSTWQKRFFHNS